MIDFPLSLQLFLFIQLHTSGFFRMESKFVVGFAAMDGALAIACMLASFHPSAAVDQQKDIPLPIKLTRLAPVVLGLSCASFVFQPDYFIGQLLHVDSTPEIRVIVVGVGCV